MFNPTSSLTDAEVAADSTTDGASDTFGSTSPFGIGSKVGSDSTSGTGWGADRCAGFASGTAFGRAPILSPDDFSLAGLS